MGKQMAWGGKGHYQATVSLQQHSKFQAPWETVEKLHSAICLSMTYKQLKTMSTSLQSFTEPNLGPSRPTREAREKVVTGPQITKPKPPTPSQGKPFSCMCMASSDLSLVPTQDPDTIRSLPGCWLEKGYFCELQSKANASAPLGRDIATNVLACYSALPSQWSLDQQGQPVVQCQNFPFWLRSVGEEGFFFTFFQISALFRPTTTKNYP